MGDSDKQNNYPMEEIGRPMEYYGDHVYSGTQSRGGDNGTENEETMEAGQGDLTSDVVEKLEQTLGIIKPEAMPHSDEIYSLIRSEGLAILKVRRVQLTDEQATQFYQDVVFDDDPGFSSESVEHLQSGPITAMVISGPNAIDHWLQLVGPSSYPERRERPDCLRARFGVAESDVKDGLHASGSEPDAIRELHFFFPELIVEPIIADSLAAYYLNENVHPVLTIGLSKLVSERPEDPVMWLADWLLANNPNKSKEQRSSYQ